MVGDQDGGRHWPIGSFMLLIYSPHLPFPTLTSRWLNIYISTGLCWYWRLNITQLAGDLEVMAYWQFYITDIFTTVTVPDIDLELVKYIYILAQVCAGNGD